MRCSMMWEIRRYTSTFLAFSVRQRGEHSTEAISKASQCYQNHRTITERMLGIAVAREVASSIVRAHLKDGELGRQWEFARMDALTRYQRQPQNGLNAALPPSGVVL